MLINESNSFKGIFPSDIHDVWKKLGVNADQIESIKNFINSHPGLIGTDKTMPPQDMLPRAVTYLKGGHVIVETEADKVETLEGEEKEIRGWDATTGELCVIKNAANESGKDNHLKSIGTYNVNNKQYIVKVLNDNQEDIDFSPIFPSDQDGIWKEMGISKEQLRQIENFIETHKHFIGKNSYIAKRDFGELPRALIFLESGDVIVDTDADKVATLAGHKEKQRGWNATTGQLCVIQKLADAQENALLETIGTYHFGNNDYAVQIQSEKAKQMEVEKTLRLKEENRPKTDEEIKEMADMRDAITCGNAEKVKALLDNRFKHRDISRDGRTISPLTYTLGYASLPDDYNGYGEEPISLLEAKNIIQLLEEHKLDSCTGYVEEANFFYEMQYKTRGIYSSTAEIDMRTTYHKIENVINNKAVLTLIHAYMNKTNISILPKEVFKLIASKLHHFVSNFL